MLASTMEPASVSDRSEGARTVLAFFQEKGRRPGDVLYDRALGELKERGLSADDYGSALAAAVEIGWIERIRQFGYRLTAKGFANYR